MKEGGKMKVPTNIQAKFSFDDKYLKQGADMDKIGHRVFQMDMDLIKFGQNKPKIYY
jgi:hypothetical protein